MLRIIAILFGIGFIFIGVAGFLPSFVINGALFNLFEVDSVHNLIHLVAGILAIMAATSFHYTKLYFKVLGVIFTIIALIGFWRNGDLYIFHVNTADNILHIVLGVFALYLGFAREINPTR